MIIAVYYLQILHNYSNKHRDMQEDIVLRGLVINAYDFYFLQSINSLQCLSISCTLGKTV